MNSESLNSQLLKKQATSLGFSACGITQARPVDDKTARCYREWIAAGRHADMQYLANNIDKRLDPTLLVSEARSIVVVATNYAPAQRIPDSEYQIAAYAYGQDYHDVVKQRLRQLVQSSPVLTQSAFKICVDTVPMLERYWAQQAGLGFIGRSHQLIIPRAGSMFFLGEIVTSAVFDSYDEPMPCHCGTCHQCVDACPTGALSLDERLGTSFNSHRCLSYQTIENRDKIDEQIADKMGLNIYGCDRCQLVCPWNRFARPTEITEFRPQEELLMMRRKDWHRLDIDHYRALFKGSAVKRAKYDGLMRNINIVREHE